MPHVVHADEQAQAVRGEIDDIPLHAGVDVHHAVAADAPVEDVIRAGPVIVQPGLDEPLKLGFFGQYRREKNLESFLQVFLTGKYNRPVKMVVQGATQTEADAADFRRIIAKYENQASIEFINRPLIGIDWQKGIDSVDALVLPYGNERYLYHTSALISNALGYRKPYVAASNVNPEVLAEYDVGVSFKSGDMEGLRKALEDFVNHYDDRKDMYKNELERAYQDFSPRRLAENIVSMAEWYA